MKTYRTEAQAFRRQAYLAREYGIFSGVQRTGNRWHLLYDPDMSTDRIDVRLRDVPAEYQKDTTNSLGCRWVMTNDGRLRFHPATLRVLRYSRQYIIDPPAYLGTPALTSTLILDIEGYT